LKVVLFISCIPFPFLRNVSLGLVIKMTGLKGTGEVCFPETLMRLEGKQNALFPEGPVINAVFILKRLSLQLAVNSNPRINCSCLKDKLWFL